MEKPNAPPSYYDQQYQQPSPQMGYPQPQMGYPQPQTGPPQQQMGQPQPPQFVSAPTIVMAPPAAPQNTTTVVNVNTQNQGGGTCPVCHAGTFSTGFTTCGWICGILCFPVGTLLCCCCMREKRCNHCGFSVS